MHFLRNCELELHRARENFPQTWLHSHQTRLSPPRAQLPAPARQCFGIRICNDSATIQILGSVPLTNETGSAPDPDPDLLSSVSFRNRIRSGSGSCSFRQWPSRCQQIIIYFCLLLLEGTFTSFFTEKRQKEIQNSRNQGSSYYFCLKNEGGSGSRTFD